MAKINSKMIGILGGTSWPSTIEYYRILNELVQEQLGGHHSANLLLRSIDYHPIKSRYHEGWDEIPELLNAHLIQLDSFNPQCIVIANNTLHKAYDLIESETALKAPVIHIVDAVGKKAHSMNVQKALLLAVKFTMEDGFYARRLKNFGVEVEIPNAKEREIIQEIQSQVSRGTQSEEFFKSFHEIINRYSNLDAVILACTELPLVVRSEEVSIPILDTVSTHCEAAVDFVLSADM